MGDEADRMQDDAARWADESEVCPRGHRYLPSEWGCYQCEIEDEASTPPASDDTEVGGE